MKVRHPIPPVQVETQPTTRQQAIGLVICLALVLAVSEYSRRELTAEAESLRTELALRCQRPTSPTQVTVSFPDGGCLTREYAGSASAKPSKARTG